MKFVIWIVAALCWVSAATAAPVKVLAFGDSLFAGFGLEAPQDNSYPAQLAKAIKASGLDVEMINAGVSGDTTSGGLERLEWSLFDEPDLVLLELGANDGLRGLSLHTMEENLRAMIELLRERNVALILFGMKATPSMGVLYQERFDAVFPRLAEEFDLPFYPFFLEGVAAVAELNQADGIHPTREGVELIVGATLPLVVKVIQKLQ